LSKSDTRLLSAEETDQAGEIVAGGGLVVFPTETVYGLGASAVDPLAVQRVFQAKNRPTDNPLIVHFADRMEVCRLLPPDGEDLLPLIENLMPGPLTLVVPAPSWAPPVVTGGLDSLAVRVPDHDVARRVIDAAGVPVAAPSANRSGRPSPTTFLMARHEMEGIVNAIVDGGACRVGIESTVVDVRRSGVLTILRPGKITSQDIARYCERTIQTHSEESHRSPGTRYRHYNPGIPVYVVPPQLWETALHEASDCFDRVVSRRLSDYPDIDSYAADLYRTFWQAEQSGAGCILMEEVPEGAAPGLYDRLKRSSEGIFRPGLLDMASRCRQ